MEPHPALPPSQPSQLPFSQLHLLGEQSPAVLPGGKIIREEFFPNDSALHWHRLDRGPVAAPSLQAFKERLDKAWSNLI